MWRGLILNRAVQQFLEDVHWGDLDYLLIDMPPGTGDIQMGLARMLPRTEMIIVTTPAGGRPEGGGPDRGHGPQGVPPGGRGDREHERLHLRARHRYALFGSGGGARLAADVGVPLIGQIPLHPSVAAGGDAGTPVALEAGQPLAEVFDQLADSVITTIAPQVAMDGCTVRLLEQVEAAVAAGHPRGPAGSVTPPSRADPVRRCPPSDPRLPGPRGKVLVDSGPEPAGRPRPPRSRGRRGGAPAGGRPRRSRWAARWGRR